MPNNNKFTPNVQDNGIPYFRFWCQKVLPLSYDDSISYYELLNKVVVYLNNVIKDVNTSVDEMSKLQQSFNALKNYVDNYFNNLDVQAEIDNKLDSMVQDGTFDAIIKQYFNRKYIFVGDSYILGYSNDGNTYNSFAKIIRDRLSLDATILGTSGAGFVHAGTGPNEGKNFLQTLQTYQGDTTAKNAITDIYVMGGYNDRTHTPTDIRNAMTSFNAYAKETFPNARVHVAFIGWSLIPAEYIALEQAAFAYSDCGLYGMAYVGNAEYILHNSYYFTNDKVHPNNEGHAKLASYLASNIMGGEIDVMQQKGQLTVPTIHNVTLGKIYASLHNNVISVVMPDSCDISLSDYDGNSWGSNWVQISGKIDPTPVLGYQETYWAGAVIWQPVDSTNWYTAAASIKLVDGVFYIQIQAVDATSHGLYSGKIQHCIRPSFAIDCPTLLS